MAFRTSARNRLPGVVEKVTEGAVMTQVDIRIGSNLVVAAITTQSARELGLKGGGRGASNHQGYGGHGWRRGFGR